MESLPRLSVADVIALIRVARLYQDALWLVEAQPPLAWLLLVSAVETAANRWRKSKGSPVERMRESKPALYDYLASLNNDDMTERVAEHIKDTLGCAKKFSDFILEFLPQPPSTRPPEEWCRYPWEHAKIRKAVKTIYGHRSRALHDGTPFPAPMCGLPFRRRDWIAPAEIPIGFAMHEGGGIWLAEDVPLLLHTFEYIVRSALLGWWRRAAHKG
jgi:hypothetical protein